MCKRITISVSILVLVLAAGVRADLEGYWKFDEGSGSTVSDSSGNGRNGTISGATWRAGGWNGAGWSLDFDGTNDLVELGAFDVVGPGLTLAAWVRPDDFEVVGSRIISKADGVNDFDHWWMLGPYPSGAGSQTLRFRLKTTDGSPTTALIAGSPALTTGQWQHVAATWDGAMMRTYVDGVQNGSVAKGGAAVATNPSVNVAVGSQPSNAFDTDPSHVNRFFDGLIDEVRVYNEALSAAEIQDLSGGVTPVPGPPNDGCASAQVVGNVTNQAFSTTGATFDGPGLCMNSPNIWYRYTATCTGNVTVSLAGSGYDTMLAVYQGSQCNPTAARLIECNDDSGSSYQSAVTFAATAGSQYLIEIGGYGSASGQGKLSISCQSSPGPPPPPPPARWDDCASANTVGNVTNQAFSTTSAIFDGPGLCMTSPNIWYRYTATCTGNVTVSLAGSSYDTMLAVYQGSQCYPNAARLIECNDDSGSSYQSAVTFAATSGSQYLIEIGGYGSATGQGKLTINCQGQTPPPSSKDDCAGAQSIGNVTNLAFETTSATFDGPGHCMNSPNIWYRYTTTCTGDVTVSLLGSSYDTKLAVYRTSTCYPAASALIECNDDYASSYQSQITFAATSGQQYLIEVGGYGSAKGQGVLTISCTGTTPTQQKPDLGDAPDSTNNLGRVMHAYPSPVLVPGNFPTVYDDASGMGPRGPAHVNTQVVAYLGKKITSETEADKGTDEDGVNNIRPLSDTANRDDGDDSVVFPLNLPNCGWANIDYTVTVVTPGTDLWVNVWLDFNRDGDWDDNVNCPTGVVPEWAVQNQYLFGLPAGVNQLTSRPFLSWHPKSGQENIWMRITLSERPWKGGTAAGQVGNGGSGPQTKYQVGETEDYYFVPQTTDAECQLCQDVNGDGNINMDDLAAFVSLWLANCQ